MSQVRYVKQRDQYSCGPVAIMNVLKWVGVKFSYQERIKLFQDLCFCTEPNGTKHAAFDKALRTTAKVLGDLQVRRVYKPKLWQMEEHLRGGGVIVLNYYWRNPKRTPWWGRHFILLTKVSPNGKYFLAVNEYQKGPAARPITRKSFKKYCLRFQRSDPKFKAWFVSIKD